MADILEKIVGYKRKEIERDRSVASFSVVDFLARAAPPIRGFGARLKDRIGRGEYALIAEVKKASPSRGVIREHFDPVALAKAYEQGGAACLSVLTDAPSFQGKPEFLTAAHEAVSLPILCKDFILDPYQVAQARSWGADCILLIMATLSLPQARELEEAALEYGMDVLCEVHGEDELEQALRLNTPLIGINNRDLHTFATDLETTRRLALCIPKERDLVIVSESGIFTHDDVCSLKKDSGVCAFLVGESLMRAENVEDATRTLLGARS